MCIKICHNIQKLTCTLNDREVYVCVILAMEFPFTDDIETAGAFSECKASPLRSGHRTPIASEVRMVVERETIVDTEASNLLREKKRVKSTQETESRRNARGGRKTRYVRWL